MHERLLILLLFVISTAISPLFAQDWVETDEEESIKIEYTVLTEGQFNRLLRQFEASNTYAMFEFVDVLLEEPVPSIIISGSKPDFNGLYYLLRKISIDRSKINEDEEMYVDMVEGNYLVYGNNNTGELTISFPSIFTAMFAQALSPANIAEISSDDYKEKIALFFDLVEEE
ncbi:MAG: hypothetical protein LBV20_02100 [Treponema sp.]|jgi:hypothetical protein|nr:hypothetical protein [Treponema sp.]